ncbi:unnamed protein product [Porites evermanni]|uniref:Calcium/calmodulin-dependent protein kinase II association-domain domain-containing protein n=1 Tax=Porites evermanni TaxID=104178 RepID=A0ABN8MP93_9CNID|nr:unnamed protein product [Porites evermanni]
MSYLKRESSKRRSMRGSNEELMVPKNERGAEAVAVAVKAREQQIIDLNHKLITSATAGDFETYCKLVDPQVTSFEPVSRGNLVEGLQFHKFYFDNVLSKRATPINWTILSPRVHMLGDDAACICYVRLQQFINR